MPVFAIDYGVSGFADFEITADRGLAENFGLVLDSLCQEVRIVDTKMKFGSLSRPSSVCWRNCRTKKR